VGFIINFSKVKKENEELKKKNAELETKVLDYDRLNEQNKTFQAQLNFKDQRSEYNYMSCSVVGKTGNDVLNGFIINRGKKDGVAVGMPIITPEGLVGIVTLTYDNSSQVQSIANENVAVAALVPRTNENTGYVKGFRDNENKMLSKLYNLPANSSIQKGDAVVTSGTGRAYPPGIRIGSVIDIEDDKAKVAKNAIIQPYVNFDKLQEVLVVIPKTNGEIKY
jgi:rod shape-determining protein MreC